MNVFKRYGAFLLAFLLMVSCMAGCTATETTTNSSEETTTRTLPTYSFEDIEEGVADTIKKTTATTKKATTTTEREWEPEPEPEAEMVWIPQSGKKYHSHAGCSGMKNPKEVTLEEAEEMGYTPCKRCY